MKSCWLILMMAFLLAGCNGKGGAFSGLEDAAITPETDGPISILSWTPTSDPVVMTSGSTTFAVALEAGFGSATYAWTLDGVSVQTGVNPFVDVLGSSLATGAHTLAVTATNSLSTDGHTFNLIKNSPPVLGAPTQSSTSISCLGGTFTMSVGATDANGDTLTFSFFLNGATGSSFLANTSNPSSGSTTFTPNCSLAGVNEVKIRVTDIHGEFDEQVTNVTVTNPSAASITSWNPTDNPVVIKSDQTTNFSITPDGTPPFITTWSIAPGGTIGSCSGVNACPFSGGGAYTGSHVITASMDDASNSTPATRAFNVIFNAKPASSNVTPVAATEIKKNCAEEITLQLNVVDTNYADPGQTHSIAWTIDGVAVPSADLTITTNTTTHPFVSSAIYKPKCKAEYLGTKTITASFTDGFENDNVSWTVTTSFMPTDCLNLTSGKACTLIGRSALLKATDMSVAANAKVASVSPMYIRSHPDNGFFISDHFNHIIWFFNNKSSGNITIMGQTVAPKNLIPLIGTGSAGAGTLGESLTNFYLSRPSEVIWDNAASILYVADSDNNRILKFNSSGVSSLFAGSGASSANGVAATTHRCNFPSEMEMLGTKLYVACTNNTTNNTDGHVKYFTTDTNLGYTVALYASGGSGVEGTLGDAGVARVRQVFGISKHPSKDLIFIADRINCNVWAANYGTDETFYGGAVTAGSGNLKALTSTTGTCDNPGSAALSYSGGGRLGTIGVETRVVNSVLQGLYLSQWDRGGVVFLNFTGSPVSVGGQAVPANSYQVVFGTVNNTQSFVRGKPAYSSTAMNHSRGMTVFEGSLYVADSRNARVASLVVTNTAGTTNVANGDVSDLIANDAYWGYDGESEDQGDLPLNEHRLSGPGPMAFNGITNEIWFADLMSGRIRALNVTSGTLRTKVGSGTINSGSASAGAARLSMPVWGIFDMHIGEAGTLAYTDTYTNLTGPGGNNANPYGYGDSANRTCHVRVMNPMATDNYWGLSITSQAVATVGGNYSLGCSAWSAGYESASAPSAPLRGPIGVGSMADGSLMWVTSRNDHCIQEIDSSGVIVTRIGLCGTSGDTSNAFSTSRLNVPGDIEMDPIPTYASSGNFFFVDRTFATGSFIKYANLSGSSIDFDGDTNPDVDTEQVYKFISVTDGYVASVAAYDDPTRASKDDWVCYSQGVAGSGSANAQNVICVTRDKASTFRVGRTSNPSTSPYFRGKRTTFPEEGANANTISLNRPWGLAFDANGNLYISDYGNNRIVMVKKWWL